MAQEKKGEEKEEEEKEEEEEEKEEERNTSGWLETCARLNQETKPLHSLCQIVPKSFF